MARFVQWCVATTLVFAVGPAFAQGSASGVETEAVESADNSGDPNNLWQQYEDAASQFSDSYDTTETVDPRATRGNRLYRQAIEDGEKLIDVLNEMLEAEVAATEEERMAVIDALLTTGQIIGSLRVEIESCQEAKTNLETVLDHPGIEERPLLQDSTQTWLQRANDCIERQEVEAARAERERQVAELERQIEAEEDSAELEELRAQLAELQGMDPDQFLQQEQKGPINAGPIAVLGTGIAVLAGAGIWDLTLGDERDTVDNYPGENSATIAQFEEAQEAADRIDNAKVPIGVMYGVGGAATIAGAIWMAVKPRKDAPEGEEQPAEESVSFNPTFQRGGLGFQVRATF